VIHVTASSRTSGGKLFFGVEPDSCDDKPDRRDMMITPQNKSMMGKSLSVHSGQAGMWSMRLVL